MNGNYTTSVDESVVDIDDVLEWEYSSYRCVCRVVARRPGTWSWQLEHVSCTGGDQCSIQPDLWYISLGDPKRKLDPFMVFVEEVLSAHEAE